jgi:uncharacterized protein YjlB
VKTESFRFADDGDIPNNPRFEMVVYREAIDPAKGDAAEAFEVLFHDNGWGGSWRNGIFPFPHYHSNAHEVLGIARGEADVRFGGATGAVFHVKAGDAVLLPAGTGHERVSSSSDLLVIGAYPVGQHADLMREGAEDRAGIRKRIAAVRKPASDPVGGKAGPIAKLWQE